MDESVFVTKAWPNRALHEWELALIAREIVVSGEVNKILAEKDFRNWNYFSSAINKLKDFENNAWHIFGDKESILDELRRIAHRQFPWQSRPSWALFLRYFKIYGNPRLSSITQDVLGMTVLQWYTIGIALTGALLNHPKFNIDANIQISTITKKEFDAFLKLTSIDLDGLNKIIDSNVRFNDEFIYTLNPLEYYPLVKIGSYYYGPLITLLIWRMTSGVYFDLVKESRFGHPFGLAFQDYILEASKKILIEPMRVLPECKYKINKKEKDSVDIILLQTEAAIFVEVKAKRVQLKTKTQLIKTDALAKDLDLLSDDIVQLYSAMEDYFANAYPHLPYNPALKIYPLIVTLEDWYLIGRDADRLYDLIKIKLQDRNISEVRLIECQYAVCSVNAYEHFLQVIAKHSIQDVMSKWFVPERRGHDFGQFIFSEYKDLYKSSADIFEGEFESIFRDILPKE